MEQSKLHQKEQVIATKNFLKDLFIKGIDAVVILFFVTTVITSAGASH